MKERTIAACLVTLLLIGGLFATKSTDAIFVVATLVFFLICIAYAEWCSRL